MLVFQQHQDPQVANNRSESNIFMEHEGHPIVESPTNSSNYIEQVTKNNSQSSNDFMEHQDAPIVESPSNSIAPVTITITSNNNSESNHTFDHQDPPIVSEANVITRIKLILNNLNPEQRWLLKLFGNLNYVVFLTLLKQIFDTYGYYATPIFLLSNSYCTIFTKMRFYMTPKYVYH